MRFYDTLKSLGRRLGLRQDGQQVRAEVHSEPVVIHQSPFTQQYNQMMLGYVALQRKGATEAELTRYVHEHPITSREGQWVYPNNPPRLSLA